MKQITTSFLIGVCVISQLALLQGCAAERLHNRDAPDVEYESVAQSQYNNIATVGLLRIGKRSATSESQQAEEKDAQNVIELNSAGTRK